MLKHKRLKEKGKISFTKYFQEFKPGDYVAVDRELNQKFGYQKKLQGRTGVIIKKRGAAYEIQLYDLNKKKTYMIKPIHLRRIQTWIY